MSTNSQDSNKRPAGQQARSGTQQRSGNKPAQPGTRPTSSRVSQPVGSKPGPIRTSGTRTVAPQQSQINPAIVVGGVAGVLILLLGAIFILPQLLSGNSATVSPGAITPGAAAGGPSTVVVETSKGTFKIRLYTDDATVGGIVKNFQDKVSSGFFDGKTFHRVENWVVQGGDPLGNGTGGGDLLAQYNQRSFTRGSLGMASTAGGGDIVNDSQWFVVKTDANWLDGDYTNFATVSEGMEVVDQIAIGDTMNKLTLQN